MPDEHQSRQQQMQTQFFVLVMPRIEVEMSDLWIASLVQEYDQVIHRVVATVVLAD